jgi:hypothetical protein
VPLADGSKVQAEPSRGGQNETKLAESELTRSCGHRVAAGVTGMVMLPR